MQQDGEHFATLSRSFARSKGQFQISEHTVSAGWCSHYAGFDMASASFVNQIYGKRGPLLVQQRYTKEKLQTKRLNQTIPNAPGLVALDNFEWWKETPLQYRPFRPKYHLTMGMHKRALLVWNSLIFF